MVAVTATVVVVTMVTVVIVAADIGGSVLVVGHARTGICCDGHLGPVIVLCGPFHGCLLGVFMRLPVPRYRAISRHRLVAHASAGA